LSTGAVSLKGDAIFRAGFGPLLIDTHRLPFEDLEALERTLARGEILLRRGIFEALCSNMVRAPVHGSTYAKGHLALAAGS
jgi:acetylornithine/succinyldiaminopimelate/putrescine aminotransferase